MSREYPWYEVVRDDGLEQGDLFTKLPVIAPHPELSFPLPADEVLAEVDEYDVILMTQSCDLANDKVRDVILCPHWDLETADIGKSKAKQIRAGREHRYLLLNRRDEEPTLDVRLVDFGRIFSLPKRYVREFAATQNPRLRLLPPYREHLAQAFARFFMRVGLPQGIEL